ncbi:YiiX/YebB-like N1pC/P60 family cysteine hydrolase [bacterium]|nr:YiiX/YebB-like N1pC/P60 family cysteine hydrolase [bacterium]MDB4332406.1 YiiX/YebB-like N1pC/P60 family cysteine hydrolase [Akkermansiaceae bacterium]
MKIHLALVFLFSSLAAQGSLFSKKSPHPNYERLRTGDIVFQDTGGAQGEAVRAATKSPFTHCGVVFETNGQFYVLEAVQPVQVIPLKRWKARSKIFHARRLKNPRPLDAAAIKKASAWGNAQLRKNYDSLFQWGDDELYCSELVWKVYKKAANIELCQPKPFSAYFLNDPAVLKIVQDRYGALEKLPKNEPVVAPSDLADSVLLVEVPRRPKKK